MKRRPTTQFLDDAATDIGMALKTGQKIMIHSAILAVLARFEALPEQAGTVAQASGERK